MRRAREQDVLVPFVDLVRLDVLLGPGSRTHTVLIVLLADVLHQIVGRRTERRHERDGPRTRVRARIVEGAPGLHPPLVEPRPSPDRVHFPVVPKAAPNEPWLVVIAAGVDDGRVLPPRADRMTVPGRVEVGR